MTATNRDVAGAFLRGTPARGGNLRSDGEYLISYRTPVARCYKGYVFTTTTWYSVTTSAHLRLLGSCIKTDSLASPIKGAVAHILRTHEAEMTKRMRTDNLGVYYANWQWRMGRLEMLARIEDFPPVQLRVPKRFLQRCAEAGVEIDFKLWALAD